MAFWGFFFTFSIRNSQFFLLEWSCCLKLLGTPTPKAVVLPYCHGYRSPGFFFLPGSPGILTQQDDETCRSPPKTNDFKQNFPWRFLCTVHTVWVSSCIRKVFFSWCCLPGQLSALWISKERVACYKLGCTKLALIHTYIRGFPRNTRWILVLFLCLNSLIFFSFC